nr:DUF2334 domain-containing protein [Nitratireductor arenosus]
MRPGAPGTVADGLCELESRSVSKPRLKPDGWSRFYIPEVHDVHPRMEASLEELLALLPPAARDRAALLVVPNWQGREPLERDGALVARLQAHRGEKVLHGWTHSLGPEFWNWLVYGHDNRSEFARLGRDEALDRLRKGRAMLVETLGAAPRWFCAPRWQQAPTVAAALGRVGIAHHQTARGLMHDGGFVPCPALNFDEGERRLKAALAGLARRPATARLLRTQTPFRLTLHPADAIRPAIRIEIEAFVRTLEADGWRPVSLDEAAARWQGTCASAAAGEAEPP